MIPILILAAGASSRMRGADKLMMDVDGAPLLRQQAKRALTVSDDVRVALPPAPHPRYDILPEAVQPVPVPDAGQGMSASLRALLGPLDGTNAPMAMILLADLPEITATDLQTVIDSARSQPDALIWRGATEDGKPGHPILIAAPLFAEFAALTGDTGGRSVMEAHRQQTVLVPLPGARARLDLDTPEDWEAWRAAR